MITRGARGVIDGRDIESKGARNERKRGAIRGILIVSLRSSRREVLLAYL